MPETTQRVLTIGDRVDGGWTATITLVEENHPELITLPPVASYSDAKELEEVFEADQLHIAPATLQQMVEAGVGPVLRPQDQQDGF